MRVGTLVLAAALAAASSGCGSAPGYGSGSGGGGGTCTAATATSTLSVALAGTSFAPSCIKVTAGSTITFTNTDSVTVHTVTTDSGQPMTFDSGNLAGGAHFAQAFPTPGETVNVHCTYHVSMGMRATIFVE
jgi:plastocyanin